MLTQIHIENFKCFNNSTIRNFRMVNLFGGKNNAGKSTLLEALFLNCVPANSAVMVIQKLRGEITYAEVSLASLDSFFLNFEKNKKIIIETQYVNADKIRVDITCDENISGVMEYESKNDANNYKEFTQLGDITNTAHKTALHILAYKNDNKTAFTSTEVVFSEDKIRIKEDNAPDKNLVVFISSKAQISASYLASDFDKAYDNGFYEDIIVGLQAIDSSIIEARTSSSTGKPLIKLRRKNEKLMPLSSFGDAIYKVMTLVLRLLNGKKGSILLVDEIENGIHHSNQELVWGILFQLAQKFEIQIFATSHSLEMITAFNKVAYRHREFDSMAMYFEMGRHVATNKIIGNPIDMEMLRYELAKNRPFRGE